MKTKVLWVVGHKMQLHDVSADYDLVFGETPANADGPPPHFHKGYKELFLLVEGELDFIVDGKPMKVSQRESVDLLQGVLHTFRNSSDKTCKWVNIHSPKGFRSFFEAMGVDANEENALLKSVDQSIIARMIKEAESFDMHIRIPEMEG